MVHRPFASFLFVLVSATAQAAPAGKAPKLPRLLQLGPMPTVSVSLTQLADGSLLGSDGKVVTTTEIERAVPTGTTELVLHVDRSTTASAITALLDAARARGVGTVHFAATLPDGTAGAFSLTLPETDEAASTITVHLHRERAGVPPSSLTPILRRMHEGFAKNAKVRFVLGVEPPEDATCEQLLHTLTAVAAAGVQAVVVRNVPAASPIEDAARAGLGALSREAAPARDGALAMDLGPTPQIQVQGVALPQPQPRVQATPFGCLL
ncbi:MAG: hypothetical protein ABIP94_12360, partial [Planctomycetota bacterium]